MKHFSAQLDTFFSQKMIILRKQSAYKTGWKTLTDCVLLHCDSC